MGLCFIVVCQPPPASSNSFFAGFINEVQALHQPGQDPKCQVTWARFETTDINDPSLYCEGSDLTGGAMPLLLVLGYNNGVQVWLIPGSGEAKLVMSRFHGQVRHFTSLVITSGIFYEALTSANCCLCFDWGW